jgi:membrane protein DedA with SNARE-associated domain
MTQAVESLRAWIEEIILAIGYPGVALIMLIENLFPPIPSEFVMPFAGFLAGRGSFDFWTVVAAGTAGAVLGAIALYYIGYFVGEPLLRVFVRRYGRYWLLSEADLDRSLDLFTRHGSIMVFVGRVIPLVRSLISIPAGMSRMPFLRFLVLTTLGSAVWSGVLAYAGLLLGENWEQILGFIERYQRFVLVALALAVVAGIARWVAVARARKAAGGSLGGGWAA